ncbi:hypothetical protein ABBQ38_014378 [Trebouxia sp. C0009 RCD-2024]
MQVVTCDAILVAISKAGTERPDSVSNCENSRHLPHQLILQHHYANDHEVPPKLRLAKGKIEEVGLSQHKDLLGVRPCLSKVKRLIHIAHSVGLQQVQAAPGGLGEVACEPARTWRHFASFLAVTNGFHYAIGSHKLPGRAREGGYLGTTYG